jgi:phosphoglycerate kinase
VGLQLSDGRPGHTHGGWTLKASITSVDVATKRVLVREDLNVPLSKDGIADDARIRAAVPTLKHLAERGAKVIVMSHLGRPKGVDPTLSLRPVAAALAKQLGREVQFAEDCVGQAARGAVGRLQAGNVLLLENVRFHPEEEANDAEFAGRLAALGEIYVNDAFAASHRAHASVVGVAKNLPAYAGELMEAELSALHKALDDPKRPLVAVVGGAKVSTKVGVLLHLLQKVDALLVGGAMANTFFKAQGYPTGSGLV